MEIFKLLNFKIGLYVKKENIKLKSQRSDGSNKTVIVSSEIDRPEMSPTFITSVGKKLIWLNSMYNSLIVFDTVSQTKTEKLLHGISEITSISSFDVALEGQLL